VKKDSLYSFRRHAPADYQREWFVSINNVVEINNLILVTTGQSIGSYDVEQLTGNFCLKL